MTIHSLFGGARDNQSMPAATVIPVLYYADVEAAAEWLCKAFGFSVRLRIRSHRVQLRVGDSSLVIAQQLVRQNESTMPNSATMIRVKDADAHFDAACRAGAFILSEPVTQPYGERQYSAKDPFGHIWTFSQSVADVEPGVWGGELASEVL